MDDGDLQHPHQCSVCTLKSDGKELPYAGLALENGFSPAYLLSLLRLVKRAAKVQRCAPLREECDKYDLNAGPCFRLGNHNDWSRWFAISSPPT